MCMSVLLAHGRSAPMFPSTACWESLHAESSRWKELSTAADTCKTIPYVMKKREGSPISTICDSDGIGCDSLIVHAADKAASSSLRAFQGVKVVKLLRNYSGYDRKSCPTMLAATSSVIGNRPARALFVRDPISRYVSGVGELLRHHCMTWITWRRKFYNNLAAQALPVSLLHPDLSGHNFSISPSDLTCKVGWGNQSLVSPFSTPALFTAVAGMILTDLSRGFRNQNVNPQAIAAMEVHWVMPQVDTLVPIEGLHGNWRNFLDAAGFSGRHLDIPHVRHDAVYPAAEAQSRLMANEGAASMFCELFRVDYACLGRAAGGGNYTHCL